MTFIVTRVWDYAGTVNRKDIAAFVFLDDARHYCDWMNWQEYERGTEYYRYTLREGDPE